MGSVVKGAGGYTDFEVGGGRGQARLRQDFFDIWGTVLLPSMVTFPDFFSSQK